MEDSETTATSAPVVRRLIPPARVAEMLGSPTSHVDTLTRTDPTFPKAVKLGPSFNSPRRFVESEVLDWIDARVAARGEQGQRDSKRGGDLASSMLEARRRARQS
jgi:predicted DNA-binding transcriptional regulator AlpA